jgi:uncharacterized damage-inducible protein DinB
MNFQELQTLLDYHYWARNRILDAVRSLSPEQYLQDLESSFRSIRDTLVHVYSAESIWFKRWKGDSPAGMLASEAYPDVDTLRAGWSTLEGEMRAFLRQLGESGIHREIEYKTFAGLPSKQKYWHMLQHVINHASYHRGQVTTMIRQLHGTAPASMDLITYYREHGDN